MGAMDNTEDTGEYGAAEDQTVLDDLREMPAGTNDPNIVGHVGPTDVPPGTDPRGDQELVTEDPGRPTEADDEPAPVE
jgi:hypothetical protein